MKALRFLAQFFHVTLLVNLGLGQAGNLLGAILDLAVGGLEAAQNAGALLDGVVAGQLVVGDAVQGTVAYEEEISIGFVM
jgi:hypothetical protein